MKLSRTFAVALAALALGAVPAVAVAGGHGKSGAPGQNKTTTNATPNTPSTTSSQTKAFGKYCQNESKTQVAGQKGTAFSQCVVALAHANNNPKTTARAACAAMSRKHVKGQGKGTAYSRCITAVAKLRS